MVEEETRDVEDLIQSVNDEIAEYRESQIEEYGCLLPDTYDKPLGHEIVLNRSNIHPIPDHTDRVLSVVSPHQSTLGVLLPRESGIGHSLQTDGMMMKHPVMEGTYVPIHVYGYQPGTLAEANYITYDNEEEMQGIWDTIESNIPCELTDAPAPDGYGQSQEGIRWVTIESVDLDTATYDLHHEEDGPVYLSSYGWIEWAVENDSPIAIIYRNCD